MSAISPKFSFKYLTVYNNTPAITSFDLYSLKQWNILITNVTAICVQSILPSNALTLSLDR